MLSDAELAAMRDTVTQTAMPDTILVTRSNGHTIDENTGNSTPNPPTTIYNGPAHVRVPDSYELDVLFGDKEHTKQRFICTLVEQLDAATMPQHDDLLVMQSGPTAHIGQPFRVVAVTGGSLSITYRLALEAVT